MSTPRRRPPPVENFQTPQRKPRRPSLWSSRRLPRPTEVEPESTCQSSLTSSSSTLWWMTFHSSKQVIKKCRYKDTKLKKSPDPQLLLHSEYSFLSQSSVSSSCPVI